MDKLELVKEFIKSRYRVNHCSFTSERSQGNYDDVFEDGVNCGTAWTLYDIGKMLEMDLKEPEEQD
jgi:hypothetical protein